MKKTLLLALAMCCLMPGSLAAKKKKTVEKKDTTIFTVVKANPITSIKDQNQSGTCWRDSSLGFFEAELPPFGQRHARFVRIIPRLQHLHGPCRQARSYAW